MAIAIACLMLFQFFLYPAPERAGFERPGPSSRLMTRNNNSCQVGAHKTSPQLVNVDNNLLSQTPDLRGRAPIASMDAMEDMEGMDILTGSNPTMQPDCHMLGKGVIPGLRYRHLGKSGLKVRNLSTRKISFLLFCF